jgi:hypothetical protein
LTEIQESGHDPSVIRRVLEARSAAFNEGRRSSPVGKLQRTLAELERKLDRLSNERGASQEEDETINYPDSDGWDDAALSAWLNPEES